MGRWRTYAESWLEAEQEGRDEAAETAFDRVFAALPGIEPSPAFAARAAEAAWVSRRRWRPIGLAAAAALTAAAAVVVYVAGGGHVAWLLTTAATAASGVVLSAAAVAVTLVGWWSAAGTAGRAVATAIASPYSVAAIVAVELIAAAALVMLHRLLRSKVELGAPRAYCF